MTYLVRFATCGNKRPLSWFFQASHWETSRAEIASVISGTETLCAIPMSVLSLGPKKVLNASTASTSRTEAS
jgi:hypothetical protein